MIVNKAVLKKTEPLPTEFYARDTAMVARELLGKRLVRILDGTTVVCEIVETEAYHGEGDAASHAANGPTPRSVVMFGPPGCAYVYFNYGVHHLLNVVTEAEGKAGAVLVRALEPVEGGEMMFKYRSAKSIKELCNGPGKLTQALDIDLRNNGQYLNKGDLIVTGGSDEDIDIAVGPRIGISSGTELPFRFYIRDNPFVSKR